MPNNISLSPWVLIAIGVIIIGWLLQLYLEIKKLKLSKQAERTDFDKEISVMQSTIDERANDKYEKFKQTELDGYKKILHDAAVQTADSLTKEWVIENEDRIRKDAIKKSMGVNLGKITEHLLPFSEKFKHFNPKDARFIGSPIDLIVFDGISDRKELINIHFIEVKTGKGVLSESQRKIWQAVNDKRIHWERIDLGEFKWES